MRNLAIVMALAVPMVWAQDMVRGTVNGKPVTQAMLEELSQSVPPEQKRLLGDKPEDLLRYYAFITRMAELAEKQKLAEQSPYKERLDLARIQILGDAMMTEKGKDLNVSSAEVEKYYEAHKEQFTTVNVTVMQVPVKTDSELAAAKAKAESLSKKLQSGGDFDAMAKEYPVDGDFKSFKKSDNIPAEIKDAVFALKPGQITKPIPRANGVFLIRLDSMVTKPLQDARGDVLKVLQDAMYSQWMNNVRESVKESVVVAK
jgi:parvulin-like peptidyl-prolyl isomerase